MGMLLDILTFRAYVAIYHFTVQHYNMLWFDVDYTVTKTHDVDTFEQHFGQDWSAVNMNLSC